MSRNLRTALIFGGFISLIGLPRSDEIGRVRGGMAVDYLQSLMRLEEYEKEQAINRAGIVQEDVQPPGLKVWSAPFDWK
ncbi:hypothetical protein FD755_015230 [Muntiacus reevesi]|uniref:Uncharacterized protein n=1 Tax=Muntiacus reevesi TaxID=9886 RepID=A0A5N3XHW2_MUNRE|nr:hypothetical protein FD755_015230 [Muntiacus reevesi]